MRIESSVTAISWIPSDAVRGMPKVPFEIGVAHYDDPPPERLGPMDLDRLTDEDAFRESNELRAWIEVDDDGKIADAGYSGQGRIGVTRVKLGPKEISIPAVALETIQAEPEIREGEARVRPVAPAAARAPPRHAASAASRTSRRRRRSRGRPSASPSGRTARRRERSSAPAPSRATGSTTRRAASWRRAA